MDAQDYQNWCPTTAKYPKAGTGELGELMYLALGLAGEAAEVANKIKKLYRDTPDDFNSSRAQELKAGAAEELGDVMWYLANLSRALETTLPELMAHNHNKLESRLARGKIVGDGDNR